MKKTIRATISKTVVMHEFWIPARGLRRVKFDELMVAVRRR
jgi:hypothetical protein